ncbi:MAG: TlyA family RNA methyltransferase [Desulfurivibrionaceae bacterium]
MSATSSKKKPGNKIRLDKLLLIRGLAESRHKAQAIIGAGEVIVDGHRIDKAGHTVNPDAGIRIKGDYCPYVSRGGLKIAKGLDHFQIKVKDAVCADIGASTGGFTDCLLKQGAARVYAVDVGYGQLAWKLRRDPRVIVLERTNARQLSPQQIPESLDLAVIDASFISLTLLIPPLLPLFHRGISILALIKPQFEVGREKVTKGGVIKDEALHDEVRDKINHFASSLGLTSRGIISSPITGPKGNIEFLIHLVSI